MKQTIVTIFALLCLATGAQAQEDSLRYKKNDGSIMAFPRSIVDYATETSDAYKVRISHALDDVEKTTFNPSTDGGGGVHPEPPYEYREDEIPCVSDGQVMATITANSEALPGGTIIIGVTSRELIECFYIAVSGQPGYYIKYPDTPTLSGEEYIYRVTMLFSQDWDHDVVITVGGHTKDGRSFTCKEFGVKYHEAGTGALQVSLSFDNAKDIDLHLYTPSGKHYYYGNKGGYTTINGQRVYVGLDVDSNAGCLIDNINCENITLPEEVLENGTYKVEVNMYKNCNRNISTGWSCVVTRGGQLVHNLITSYGNPASGVYPVGQSNGDHTQVMMFNVETASQARSLQRRVVEIEPVPLDDRGLMKLEEENERQANPDK